MSLTVKKVNDIFKSINLNIIVDKVYFVALWIPWEKTAKLKKIDI